MRRLHYTDFCGGKTNCRSRIEYYRRRCNPPLCPSGEKLEKIIERVRAELGQPIMADVALFDEGLNAAEKLGIDVISTMLSGYTAETSHLIEPDFKLVE